MIEVTNSKNEKTKSWYRSRSRFFYRNEILYKLELFRKNKGLPDFKILDTDLAFSRYCLRSWDHSVHALRYAVVFFIINFCCWLVLLLVNIWYLYECWDSNGWCNFIDISIYKITEAHPAKPNQEWPHIALPCYNESEKVIFIWNS